MNVLCFMLDRQSNLLLLLRRTKPDDWVGRFNGIAGKIRPDETPQAAAVRKAEDEVGVKTQEAEWQYHGVVGDLHILSRDADHWNAHQMIGEGLVRLPLTTDWIHEPVLPNLRYILPLVIAGVTFEVKQ